MRFRAEAFGNGGSTERSYFTDKQRIKSLVTESGATVVQSLGYVYEARLNLSSRTDALQPQQRCTQPERGVADRTRSD